MNRTLVLRVEVLTRRRTFLSKKLADLGLDAPPSSWVQKELDALDWVLRLVGNLEAEGALEQWS